jgi:hypothetical protein
LGLHEVRDLRRVEDARRRLASSADALPDNCGVLHPTPYVSVREGRFGAIRCEVPRWRERDPWGDPVDDRQVDAFLHALAIQDGEAALRFLKRELLLTAMRGRHALLHSLAFYSFALHSLGRECVDEARGILDETIGWWP